jgi:hypothetical protein
MTMQTANDTSRTKARRSASPRKRLLPDPAPRVGAHAYAGKRVRDDVREAVLVMGFSVLSAVGLAACLTTLVHLLG